MPMKVGPKYTAVQMEASLEYPSGDELYLPPSATKASILPIKFFPLED